VRSALEVETLHKFARPANQPLFHIDGNAVLVRAGGPAVVAHETLPLSDVRSAQRALLDLGGGTRAWFVNTHLHHLIEDPGVRLAQATALLDWMDAPAARAAAGHTIIVGDFNAPPSEPGYALFGARGYTSAYAATHGGVEPERTFPSRIVAPTMHTDPAMTTDYVWVRGAAGIEAAALAANAPAPHDATLYPSDHYGVVAVVTLLRGT
jgi:endonuclease/exonuclease/phosphatase family metal-dependent hydrolase